MGISSTDFVYNIVATFYLEHWIIIWLFGLLLFWSFYVAELN